MDNKSSQVVNPPIENPSSQIDIPSSSKSLLSNKIIILAIVVLILIFAGIGGTYLISNLKKENPPPTISKTTPTPAPTLDPTASWKTFVDQSLKISFDYPRDWQVQKDETGGYHIRPLSYKGSDLVINISFYENQNALSLAEIDAELDSKKSSTGESTGKSDLSKNNISIKTSQSIDAFYRESFICPPLTCSRYIIPYKDKVYIIANLNQPVVENQLEIFKKIFSTFKFTDANQTTDTSTWKTYKDLKTGASFKYAPNYVFSEYFYNNSGVLTLFESNERKENAEKNGHEGCSGCSFTIKIDQKLKNNTDSLETYFLKNDIDKSKFYPIEVNGLKALKSEEPGICLYNQVFIDNGNRVLIVAGCAMQLEKQAEFQQILSTFKFTN